PSMEELACQRMGVGIEPRTSSSDAAAERSLKGELEAGHPVMIQLDMGYLPYFDFGGSDYHFGGHVVVVCGKDEDRGEYLIADRDAELHAVPAPALSAARGSKHRPFPPGRAWWRFEFAGFHEPSADDILIALGRQCSSMLSPPISNLGVSGVRKAAGDCLRWPELLKAEELAATLFNIHIFASEKGGSGGGLFRYMFAAFLLEAGDRCGGSAGPALRKLAGQFRALGDAWEEVGSIGRMASEGSGMEAGAARAALPKLSKCLEAAAALEGNAWRALALVLESS
ncbi:MAG TPA: BtrH N-terminal domain-containing protein, partial [Rectinemataceae bacterium]|nr:BtrH N-terminal domain-containing protein [Rectinemataceae bacterium]